MATETLESSAGCQRQISVEALSRFDIVGMDMAVQFTPGTVARETEFLGRPLKNPPVSCGVRIVAVHALAIHKGLMLHRVGIRIEVTMTGEAQQHRRLIQRVIEVASVGIVADRTGATCDRAVDECLGKLTDLVRMAAVTGIGIGMSRRSGKSQILIDEMTAAASHGVVTSMASELGAHVRMAIHAPPGQRRHVTARLCRRVTGRTLLPRHAAVKPVLLERSRIGAVDPGSGKNVEGRSLPGLTITYADLVQSDVEFEHGMEELVLDRNRMRRCAIQ